MKFVPLISIGSVSKPTYDEPEDWRLSAPERQVETVRRIRLYLHALVRRQPERQAA